MSELTAEQITKSLKEGKTDPRMTKEQKFNEDSHDPKFLEKLRGGIDYWHFISIGDFELPVRLLSIKETMDTLMETQSWFNALADTQKLPDLWVKKQAVLTLLKAMNSTPDDKAGHKYYVSEETLMRLEDRVFITLFRAYMDICEKYDASIDNLTDDEYKSIVEDLKKNPSLQKHLSRLQLEQIVRRLLQDNITLRDSFSTVLLQKPITTSQ